jgi:hypothetical protein
MRLLHVDENGEFSLTDDLKNEIPPYAILSHTWGPDNEEVNFKDLTKGPRKAKAGYKKLRFCAEQATRDGLQYVWIDTCCIDKSSSAELSEAINSMFRWYRDSDKCYVYLSDVSSADPAGNNQLLEPAWTHHFRISRWFSRGWTLQELLAPSSIEFFSMEGTPLGDRTVLEQQIHQITGIPVQALQGSLSGFSIDERMSWAAKRQTKREEDAAYCLLGIFDIHLPLIYGEGRKKAFRRLYKDIKDATASHPSALPAQHSSTCGLQTGEDQNKTLINIQQPLVGINPYVCSVVADFSLGNRTQDIFARPVREQILLPRPNQGTKEGADLAQASDEVDDSTAILTNIASTVRLIERICRCRRLLSQKSSRTLFFGLETFFQIAATHRKDCPYFRKENVTKKLGLSFRHLSKMAGLSIQASLVLQFGAGSLSINPYLALRGVSRYDSPAFTLFYDLGWESATTLPEYVSIMRQLPGRLHLLFANGEASPHETDRDGSTLFHVGEWNIHSQG